MNKLELQKLRDLLKKAKMAAVNEALPVPLSETDVVILADAQQIINGLVEMIENHEI